jgi:hypothetical protein
LKHSFNHYVFCATSRKRQEFVAAAGVIRYLFWSIKHTILKDAEIEIIKEMAKYGRARYFLTAKLDDPSEADGTLAKMQVTRHMFYPGILSRKMGKSTQSLRCGAFGSFKSLVIPLLFCSKGA